MQVIKFGGSSVASAENIEKVVSIIQSKDVNKKLIIVVSALGGITDMLLDAATLAANADLGYTSVLQKIRDRHLQTLNELFPSKNETSVTEIVQNYCNEIDSICNGIYLLGELSLRTKDKIVSYGELLSSQIIASKLNDSGITTTWTDSRVIIKTNDHFGSAVVDFEKTNQVIADYFTKQQGVFFIMPGFIASNHQAITTTLGRGGSDYTAAIVAAALKADSVEIWTDVSGMMTADPRIVNNYKLIPVISYQEAMELSHFGAKVIYPPTIQPVMNANIPVWIKNTFAPQDEGTLIQNASSNNKQSVQGISSINKVALLSLEGSGMVGIPGFSMRLFEALASQKINVILITQSSSEHSICVCVDSANAVLAKEVVDKEFEWEIETGKLEPLIVENELAVIAIVGDQMKNHTGISGRMFSALGKNGVNIRAIAQGSSERNISAVIAAADVKKAVNVLHEEFFETSYKQVHLFIAGAGNVGSKLLNQLKAQSDFLKTHLRIDVKVVGLANSQKALLNDEGIDLANWKALLIEAPLMTAETYINTMIEKNMRNSIFVDITANDHVATLYNQLLQKSIAVVACNKVACSSEYSLYQQYKNSAREFNAKFLFETNVGAGLPIISTLNDLVSSGDVINKMQAVLSGTLNYVFNNYDGTVPFAQIVKRAQDEGYTEPDPRLDLSGKDVMRKIMILARECGVTIEMSDIANNSFMPESCMKGTVNDFYEALVKEEEHFKNLYLDANSKQCKLKFVASFDNGKASVGLQHIDENHDFYHLYGKDNIVLFYTNRYAEQPLVVKGAGAGAEVTASGVFADIIRASV